ncbi:hypothetical protein L9F63_016937, partial [Diploptera punctata]
FVHELDDLLSSWLGVRMFAFQMVAIGEVFQVIVNLDDWEVFSRHLLILFVTLSQILVYCWFGEQVLQGGWDVDRAVYETPWYTYSQKYKKHLVLVIMRAHEPVEITVGHYYSLSLQSCELDLENVLRKVKNLWAEMLRFRAGGILQEGIEENGKTLHPE